MAISRIQNHRHERSRHWPASLYSTHVDQGFRPAATRCFRASLPAISVIIQAMYPKWRSPERPLELWRYDNRRWATHRRGLTIRWLRPRRSYGQPGASASMDKRGIDVAVCFRPDRRRRSAPRLPATEAAQRHRLRTDGVGNGCGAFPSRIKAVGIVPAARGWNGAPRRSRILRVSRKPSAS